MPSTFTSWSFSRYSDWARCPLFAKLKHLDKMPTSASPAMARGGEIAKLGENFLKGALRTLPAELKPLGEDFKFLKKQKTKFVEEQWGFDREWLPVAWNDWDRCWLRVKVDVGYVDGHVVHIRDAKTGKMREEKNEEDLLQLDLYVAAGATQFPDAKQFTSQLLYTDMGVRFPEKAPVTVSRAAALKRQAEWNKRVKPMFNDRKFVARPGFYCRWCDFSKSKGGPCKY